MSNLSGHRDLRENPVSIEPGVFHTSCTVDRIRSDRILHEALTAGPDPLHLTLVFGISHNTAARYAAVADHLLSDELEHPPAD